VTDVTEARPPRKGGLLSTGVGQWLCVTGCELAEAGGVLPAQVRRRLPFCCILLVDTTNEKVRNAPPKFDLPSVSHNGPLLAAILGNPMMIDAYLGGVPGNGKSFPDGAKMAKIHWNPKTNEYFQSATVPGTQHDVDFMVKDSKRFADSGGWGWAVFEYDAASNTFTPGTLASCGASTGCPRTDRGG
jgi:hypothetical protein